MNHHDKLHEKRLLQQISEPENTPAASAGYSCWQLLPVRKLDGVSGVMGCLQIVVLPKSLIGKTVKVTIEEQL